MRILRWIFYLALAVAVVYGGYLIYMKWMQGQPISSLWQKAREYASGTAGTVQAVQQTVGKIQKSAASTRGIINSAKTSLGDVLANLGKTIENAGTMITGTTNISRPFATTSSSALSPSPTLVSSQPAMITTTVGIPLYFSLTIGRLYSITWGDGTTSTGSLSQGTPTIVKHSWPAVGNYTVQVTIDDSSYTFPIRVYNQ
jgi:hypothetical protein